VRKIQRGEFPTPHYNFLNEHTVNALKAAGDSLCVCVCVVITEQSIFIIKRQRLQKRHTYT